MSDDKRPRIAVFGDFMTDIDVHCVCERICQEGPWPVLKEVSTTKRPGGAANVAMMCRALGCDVREIGFSVRSTKTRLFVDKKHIGPRIDSDNLHVPENEIVDKWIAELINLEADAIIVADHGKGAVTEHLMQQIGHLGIPTFVDPVKSSPITFRVDAIVGGVDELDSPYLKTPKCLIKKLGDRGIQWWTLNQEGQLKSCVTNAVDPLGAGDQFISVLAWRRCLGDTWPMAIEKANVAAGMQCQRRGCVPVTAMELEDSLNVDKACIAAWARDFGNSIANDVEEQLKREAQILQMCPSPLHAPANSR